MKNSILALGLLTSLSAFAQVNNGSAMEVCDAIRRVTTVPARVTTCVQIVSQNRFDRNVIPVITALAQSSTVEALNSLNAAANAMYDSEAINVCENIRRVTTVPARVTECIAKTANNTYAIEVSQLAARLTQASTVEANAIMSSNMNAYFMPQAVDACEAIRIVTTVPARVTACVNTIKNKSYMNQSAEMCRRLAQSSTVDAVNCLSQAGVEYIPAPNYPAPGPTYPTPTNPGSRDLIISRAEMMDLKRDLKKTRTLIERGMTENALRTLNDAVRAVETMEARN